MLLINVVGTMVFTSFDKHDYEPLRFRPFQPHSVDKNISTENFGLEHVSQRPHKIEVFRPRRKKTRVQQSGQVGEQKSTAESLTAKGEHNVLGNIENKSQLTRDQGVVDELPDAKMRTSAGLIDLSNPLTAADLERLAVTLKDAAMRPLSTLPQSMVTESAGNNMPPRTTQNMLVDPVRQIRNNTIRSVAVNEHLARNQGAVSASTFAYFDPLLQSHSITEICSLFSTA